MSGGYPITPVLSDVYTSLQTLLANITGLASTLVIQGLPNRAAMPPALPGYISMQAVRLPRLRTNIDSWDITNPDPTVWSIERGTEIHMQLDCYGASSGDWATAISAVFRDGVGCDALAPTCQPLYTDEPILAPLDDSEEQYEARWVVMAHLQYNPVVSAPLQTANTLEATLVDVDVTYPPS